MACNSRIVVATSIPPKVVRHVGGRDVGQAYQSHCIESWTSAGFRVLSLNFPNEISELIPRYPRVQFIAVDRDSGKLSTRAPQVNQLLGVLGKQQEDIVGIINADIFLEAKDWISAIRASTKGAIAIAQRLDVKSFEDSNPTPYAHGYDLFFFERKEMPTSINGPFEMGVPWWDYCLPVAFRLRGLRVNLLRTPAAFHLWHPMKYDMPIWRQMGKEFSEFVVKLVDVKPRPSIAQDLSLVIRLSRKIAAGPALREDIQLSLLARGWSRMLVNAGRLPTLGRFISEYHGQDANLQKLSKACMVATSPPAHHQN